MQGSFTNTQKRRSIEDQDSLSKDFLNYENTEKYRDRERCECITHNHFKVVIAPAALPTEALRQLVDIKKSSQINPITQFKGLKPGTHLTPLWQETENAPGTTHFCTVTLPTIHNHAPPSLYIFIFKQLSTFDTKLFFNHAIQI